MSQNGELLRVENLKTHFPIRKGVFSRVVGQVKAVDGVSFHVGKAETLGLVGESGCGKTTVGRSLLRLIEPTAGGVWFGGEDVLRLGGGALRRMRRRMQIIFQDPYSSLNPRMTVLDIVGESLSVHGIAKGKEKEDRVKELLERVGLDKRYVNRYPHEFSGGQRQRIGIARALALGPEFIVCDEAVSALDVSIQAQVINLLMDLKEEFGLAYLFIAHDLSVVRHISDRVAVMYLGEIVETAGVDALFESPHHPYTQALLSAVPVADPTRERSRIVLEGDVPTPINPPSGCHFHPRCRFAEEICSKANPGVTDAGDGHTFRCHVAAREFPESATQPSISG
ncbi:MAG: ABC transporter ATP-binding protein [Planctomycetota bacterium]